jgi:hypothetical protein
MMRNKVKSAVLSLASIVSACSPPAIELKIMTIDELRIVSLSQNWAPFGLKQESPCIRQIELREGSDWKGPVVWKTELKTNQQCKRNFGAFVIGKTPSGFVTTMTMPELAKGKRYHISVNGIGGGELSLIY